MSASPLSPEGLEQRARQQRERLHVTAHELISKIDDARQRLTLSYNLRKHFVAFALIAAALSLVSGYALGVALTRKH